MVVDKGWARKSGWVGPRPNKWIWEKQKFQRLLASGRYIPRGVGRASSFAAFDATER
jgi:hypothetical protein